MPSELSLQQQIEKVTQEVAIIKKVILLARKQSEKRDRNSEEKVMDGLLQQLEG